MLTPPSPTPLSCLYCGCSFIPCKIGVLQSIAMNQHRLALMCTLLLFCTTARTAGLPVLRWRQPEQPIHYPAADKMVACTDICMSRAILYCPWLRLRGGGEAADGAAGKNATSEEHGENPGGSVNWLSGLCIPCACLAVPLLGVVCLCLCICAWEWKKKGLRERV